jgi:hypothetical protein
MKCWVSTALGTACPAQRWGPSHGTLAPWDSLLTGLPPVTPFETIAAGVPLTVAAGRCCGGGEPAVNQAAGTYFVAPCRSRYTEIGRGSTTLDIGSYSFCCCCWDSERPSMPTGEVNARHATSSRAHGRHSPRAPLSILNLTSSVAIAAGQTPSSHRRPRHDAFANRNRAQMTR